MEAKKYINKPVDPEELVLVSTFIATYISTDMSLADLQTAINILSIVISTLNGILTQKQINKSLPTGEGSTSAAPIVLR